MDGKVIMSLIEGSPLCEFEDEWEIAAETEVIEYDFSFWFFQFWVDFS